MMERPLRENVPEPLHDEPAETPEENAGNGRNGRHVRLSPDNIWYQLRLGR